MEIFITSLTVLLNLTLGWVVWSKNKKSATNRLLMWLSVVVSVWAVTNHVSVIVSDLDQALFWIRAVMVTVGVMFPLILILADTFPEKKVRRSSSQLKIMILASLVIGYLSTTPLIFEKAVLLEGKITPVPGKLISLFGLYVVLNLFFTLYVLLRRRKRKKGLLRTQIGIILLGLGTTFLLSFVTTFIFVTLLKITSLVILGPSYSLFLVAAISYAIIRHRFLDISYLIGRAVLHLLLLIVLVIIFNIIIFGISEVLFLDRQLEFVLLAMIAAFSFNPLKNLLSRVTDKFLFKGIYDHEKLLIDLTQIMASEIEIDVLCEGLAKKIVKDMRLTGVAFLIFGKKRNVNIYGDRIFDLNRSLNNYKKLALSTGKSIIFLEDIKRGKLKDLVREKNIAALIPLKVNKKIAGTLLLGQRASGEAYSNKDVDFLEIFSQQAALAIQNSKSYKEVQEFNKTLEKKVEERTQELRIVQARELEKAKELLVMKDEFLNIVSHDLKSPVAAINGYVELIESSDFKMSKKLVKYFNGVTSSSARLTRLIKDLLEMARLEAGMLRVKKEKVEIGKLIKSVANQFMPEATKKGIKIKTLLDNKHLMVEGNGEKLTEVFENLISNAIKYNKESGAVVITSQKARGMLEVSVVDAGIGIPESRQKNIFKKFYRAHEGGVDGVVGTGLGLFVVKTLVEKMGGDVWFKSKEGGGSEFTVSIKLMKKS